MRNLRSDSIELTERFAKPQLSSVTPEELAGLEVAGWAFRITDAPVGHSAHFFERTINCSEKPLKPGEKPTMLATVWRRNAPETTLSSIKPIESIDKNSPQYALTCDFTADLDGLRAGRHIARNQGLIADTLARQIRNLSAIRG